MGIEMAAIYFDLDGTLLTYSKDFKTIFEEGIGSEADQEVFEFWSKEIIGNLEELVNKPYLEALRSVEEEFDLGLEVEEARERYLQSELDATVRSEELVRLLRKYSEQHKVGILTNGDGEMQRRKIEKHRLDQFADTVIISNSEGVRKPSPEIFELAKERLPAEKYVYIGDSFEEDIKPAEENGFEPVYTENGKVKQRISKAVK